MSTFILSGSHRPSSQSEKVAKYLANRVDAQFPDSKSDLFTLAGNPLPLWDESVWEGGQVWKEKWDPIKARLEKADRLIVVTPEWGGMCTPGVRNFLLLCAGGPIAHKPGMIVSVSGSRNGAYPVTDLRSLATKNNQLCWIPEHIIVREAEKMLVSDNPESEDDEYLRKRIDYALSLLQEYAKAFSQIRKSGVIDSKNYPFGM